MCLTTTSKQSQFRTFCMSGHITRLSIRELSSYGFLNYLFLPTSKKICTLTLLLVSINAVLKSIGDEFSFICCTLPKMLAKCNFLNRLRCSQFRTVFMSSENCHKQSRKKESNILPSGILFSAILHLDIDRRASISFESKSSQ